jgi:hypothetical protein
MTQGCAFPQHNSRGIVSVRLEPARTSLSGRPEFLQPPAKVQAAPKPLGPRKCISCGVTDVAQTIHDETVHSVTIELRYLKAENELTPYLKAKGWRYRFHQGRHSMERDICRACLIAHGEMEKEFQQKRSRELKKSGNHDTYYTALCGE